MKGHSTVIYLTTLSNSLQIPASHPKQGFFCHHFYVMPLRQCYSIAVNVSYRILQKKGNDI